MVKLAKLSLTKEGTLKGDLSTMTDNYEAYIGRNRYHRKKSDEEFAKTFFKEDLANVNVLGLTVKNEEEKNTPLILELKI